MKIDFTKTGGSTAFRLIPRTAKKPMKPIKPPEAPTEGVLGSRNKLKMLPVRAEKRNTIAK